MARGNQTSGQTRGRNRTTVQATTNRDASLSAEEYPPLEDVGDSDNESDSEQQPAVLVSPIKRRSRQTAPTINKQSDLEVWDLPDLAIVDAAKAAWRSECYEHYDISLDRIYNPDETPSSLTYVFTCKSRVQSHKAQFRPRSKTSEGTSNLVKTLNLCLAAQGISQASNTRTDLSIPVYTATAHRALLALRCARSQRPFNSVTDEDYRREVDMLRPGAAALLPAPITISRDIKAIYVEMSKRVAQYFEGIGTVHLVLDGWTSPLQSSYLGIVVVWYDKGTIHRAILEFIRLTQKHDGRYLAEVVGHCVQRFGLEKKLFSLCMDNASNCDKTAELLPNHLPDFGGEDARLRCTAHIVNLIAKACINSSKIFISFFFKKKKTKKRVTVARGASNSRFTRPGESEDFGDEDEVVLDSDEEDGDEDDLAVIEEAEAEILELENAGEDEGQGVHNDRVCRTLRDKAIDMMRRKGVVIDSHEKHVALQIFPRVAGLARRVRENAVIKERFLALVEQDADRRGTQRTLSRRVPTRWNSNLNCLLSHFFFREITDELTSIPSLRLRPYHLDDKHWKIAEEAREVLLLFETITRLFSTHDVPLIVDVIPTLEDLREGLIAARDDTENDVSTVVQVACQASILLIDKYSVFAENCDIYLIALVLCPDRKLKWFKDHGRNSRQIKDIEKLVIAKWNQVYAPEETDNTASAESTQARTRSRYARAPVATRYPPDHIMTYLKDPLLPTATIEEAGGYLKYWHQAMSTRPCLARMASDFCSAPATSVDAERAFSTGRRQINFMQHNTSSQTFKAKVAVGSWVNSPLFPGFDVQKVIEHEVDLAENPFVDQQAQAPDPDAEEVSEIY